MGTRQFHILRVFDRFFESTPSTVLLLAFVY